MDLEKLIRELRDERDHIDRAIEVLEGIQGERPAAGKRGRKSMSDAERRQVSRRMREYWAKKRKENSANNGQ